MSEIRIRLGGLWKNTSKNGVTYLAGSFGQARLLIFRNDEKRSDQAPDYTMYLVPDERRNERRNEPEPAPPEPEDVPF